MDQEPCEVGRLLAVDLDETLIEVNSFPLLVRQLPLALIRAGRPLSVMRLAVALARRKLLRSSHAEFKSVVCLLSESADSDTLDRWASRVLERHQDRRVVATIAEWSGPCVLTSAAPQAAVERLAREVGCSFAHGSHHVNGCFVENVGATKVERLSSAGLPTPAMAISDDEALDAPLLGLAGRAFVIGHDRSIAAFDSFSRSP